MNYYCRYHKKPLHQNKVSSKCNRIKCKHLKDSPTPSKPLIQEELKTQRYTKTFWNNVLNLIKYNNLEGIQSC